ncbi:tRNA (guanosine(37)-N1)-methyltransferase TrmD [Roseateles sp.]|uniref:tRNA (guanosine(37)-N1)-methyltransferase TrmD n=1 Tax=Roseateles sp. TaxID=1971397 RepID=UPI0032631A62
MRFDVLTIFPELFAPHMTQGVTRRAFESRQVDVRLWPLREFADDNYRRVDDRPYGGGPGMVMLVEPLEKALAAVKADRAEAEPAVIYFTPTGARIDQACVQQLSVGPGAILLCGRYEGIDQRVLDRHVTLELSLGDFVLSGGELPALALLDAVARLQDGVLGDAQSHQQDSFSQTSDGMLDCPHYSRPEVLADGRAVPAVLMSGHHADIKRWRREQSLALTAARRPELIAAARATGRLSKADEAFLAKL